jgi:WD40 repeat protein
MRRLLLALLLFHTCTFLAFAVPNDTSPIARLGRGYMNAADFSPDDRWFATASQDGELNLWDNWDGSLVRHLAGHTGDVIGVRFSPDGHSLYSLGADATLRRWDISTGQQLLCRAYMSKPDSFDLNSSGTLIAIIQGDGRLQLCDPFSGDPLTTVTMFRKGYWAKRVRFSPKGNYLLVDPRFGAAAYILDLHGRTVWSSQQNIFGLYMDSAEKTFIYARRYSDNVWYHCDLSGKILQQGSTGYWGYLTGYLPETNQIIMQDTSFSDLSPQLLDLDTMTKSVWGGPKDNIIEARLDHTGELLQVAGSDGHIWSWRRSDGTLARNYPVHSYYSRYVEFSHDSKKVLVASDEGLAEEYDLQGKLLYTYIPSLWKPYASSQVAHYSDDDQLIGMASNDGNVWIWNAQTHDVLFRFFWPGVRFYGSLFVPGSHLLTVNYWDGTNGVFTCDADTGKINKYPSTTFPTLFIDTNIYLHETSEPNPILTKHQWPGGATIQSLSLGVVDGSSFVMALSPDRKTLIDSTFAGWIFFIDVPSMTLIKSMQVHTYQQGLQPFFVKFLPDGGRFLIGWAQQGDEPLAEQKEAELRDVRTGNLLQTFDPPGGDYCTGGDVSPDGQYAAIAQGGFTYLFRLPANAAREWGLYP